MVNTTVAERLARWRRCEISPELVAGSEAGRRLIKEERPRIGEELDGDAGALALPAAERADPNVGVVTETNVVERRADDLIDLGRGCCGRQSQSSCITERVAKGEVGVNDVVLRHIADHAPELPQIGLQVDAVVTDRSLAGPSDPGHRLQQRRLARTAGTDDRDELTGGDGERHTVQESEITATTDGHPPGQVVHLDAETRRSGIGGGRRRRGVDFLHLCLHGFS